MARSGRGFTTRGIPSRHVTTNRPSPNLGVWVAVPAGGNWNATGTWVNGSVPTSSSNVRLLESSGNVTINAAASCRSLDCLSYAGTLTHNAAITLSIGGTVAGYANRALRLVSGMTYTLGNAATSAISFVSTSTTQQSVDAGGKTVGNVTLNSASGSWALAANLTSSGTSWTYTAGTWSGVGFSQTYSTASGITFAGGGQSYGDTSFASSVTMTGANTFASLTYTGTAAKTNFIDLAADQIVTGTLTIAGNSKINRVQVRSSVIGTARTLTCGSVSINAADFRDITAAGSASWDISAASDYTGDCGGNTGITFTTPATQTWSGTVSDNWSTNAWTSRVPLPQDDVVVSSAFSASQTVTVDMPRWGRSVSFAGSTGSPTLARGLSSSIFGSLTLASGMTFNGSFTLTLEGRSNFTITRNGATISTSGALSFAAPGGTYTFQDGWSQSTANLSILNGTVDLNGQSHTFAGLTSGNTNVRSLVFGSSTLTLASSGSPVSCSPTTNFTISAGTGVIALTDTSVSASTFAGGGATWPEVRVTTGGSGALTFTGANTFTRLSVTGGSTKSFVLPGSTTTTFSGSTPFPSGASLNLLTFTASAGSATVASSQQISCDYVSLTNIIKSGATAYAGTHSTDGTGNTGWSFTAPSGGGGGGGKRGRVGLSGLSGVVCRSEIIADQSASLESVL